VLHPSAKGGSAGSGSGSSSGWSGSGSGSGSRSGFDPKAGGFDPKSGSPMGGGGVGAVAEAVRDAMNSVRGPAGGGGGYTFNSVVYP
jgi:hypothetical protein